ncbi:hypothetical protein EXS73_02495 [Candidatus Pacearchaeota archaeon]|nr:hypothetical protein [Candidatus Pacearchaeota archaeon]
MYLHQWQLQNKKRGAYFPYNSSTMSLDYEWQYRFDEQEQLTQIGITGWPDRKNCMVWQAMNENVAFHIREYQDTQKRPHITLHTTSTLKKGKIITSTSGIHETSRLIAFIKEHRDVHLYHASQFKSGEEPDILIFDQNPPSTEPYKHDRSVPVRISGKGFYVPLLAKIFNIITRGTQPRVYETPCTTQ